MAHFAEIDKTGLVLRVIVVNNDVLVNEHGVEDEEIGAAFCRDLLGGRWVQTSYNGRFRKNYAAPGHIYDLQRDAFIAPQPYPSWSLNEDTCRWLPPTPMPNDGAYYAWDETQLSWQKTL